MGMLRCHSPQVHTIYCVGYNFKKSDIKTLVYTSHCRDRTLDLPHAGFYCPCNIICSAAPFRCDIIYLFSGYFSLQIKRENRKKRMWKVEKFGFVPGQSFLRLWWKQQSFSFSILQLLANILDARGLHLSLSTSELENSGFKHETEFSLF